MTDWQSLLAWPALACKKEDISETIIYERAVWGKVHRASSDYRWIVLSEGFTQPTEHLEKKINLGREDIPCHCDVWKSDGDIHYAVHAYPSRATDSSGRSNFLEKQVIQWERQKDTPALLAMLILLPLCATFNDDVWWDRYDDQIWLDPTRYLDMESDHYAPLRVDIQSIWQAIETGQQQLLEHVNEAALAQFYAQLIAGNKGLDLAGFIQSLPAQSLAALLLPLPRDITDQISMISWLPSYSVGDFSSFVQQWHGILGGESDLNVEAEHPPTDDQHTLATKMARALTTMNPKPLLLGSGDNKAANALIIWGAIASGKTAYLANLSNQQTDKLWRISSTKDGVEFNRGMFDTMVRNNGFPMASTAGLVEKVILNIQNCKTGTTAKLYFEERAGVESEQLSEGLKKAMHDANGILLFLDSTRKPDQSESEIKNTLEDLRFCAGRESEKEQRPVAICCTKADYWIQSSEDLECASSEPDAFSRSRLTQNYRNVLAALDHELENYMLFPVSSVGVEHQFGNIERTIFLDETGTLRLVRGNTSINVIAPIVWLLEKNTAMKS